VITLRQRALAWLARREHSRAELARKLAAHDEFGEAEELLSELQREGLLSDSRYAEVLAHARASRHGSLRLKADLRGKGVGEADAAQALAKARASDLATARAVWAKKFAGPPGNAAERAKQTRFLAGRGFPLEVIRRVLGGCDDED
jgi:regulatory protein